VNEYLYAFGVDVNPETVVQFHKAYAKLRKGPKAPVAMKAPPEVSLLPSSLQCQGCGNSDERKFDTTMDTAEVVCIACGAVAVDHVLYGGVAERDFADSGEESKSHASYPHRFWYLMSDSYNLQTAVKETAACAVEDTPCRTDTSTWRRDVDKQKAIGQMEAAGDRLRCPALAIIDAIELFAEIRDSKQRVGKKDLQKAVCLYACTVSLARRQQLPPSQEAVPTIQCLFCDEKFVTVTERAKHCANNQPCRMAARKKDQMARKRISALDMNVAW